MSKYIDANELLELYDIDLDGLETDKPWTIPLKVVKQNIKDMPTADVEPVTRCKDCKYNPSNPRSWDDDDIVEHYLWCEFMAIESKYNYCSKGKRSEE